MYKCFRQTVRMLVICLAVNAGAVMAQDWELERDSDGIRVHTRAVSGSDFREFRGETVIDAELNRLMALLDDTAACGDWMHNCKRSKLLYKPSLLERYLYLINDFPWPASDREMIVRNRIRHNPETRVTTVELSGVDREALPEAVRAKVPEPGGNVPVSSLDGFFELTPLDGASTRVIYQMHLNPGGKLSAGLVNSKNVDTPFETLKNMREVVQRDKYRCFRPF